MKGIDRQEIAYAADLRSFRSERSCCRRIIRKLRMTGLIFLTTHVALRVALLIVGIMGDIAGAYALGLPLGATA